MFKNLIRKLYLKYCDPDIVAMTRQQLECFNEFKKVELSDDEKEKVSREAQDLQRNSFLLSLFDEVVTEIKENMLLKTNAEFIIYDRFSINGVNLLKEKLAKYANLVPTKDEEFDQYSLD